MADGVTTVAASDRRILLLRAEAQLAVAYMDLRFRHIVGEGWTVLGRGRLPGRYHRRWAGVSASSEASARTCGYRQIRGIVANEGRKRDRSSWCCPS
jgi:hypothetical protein